MLSVLHSRIVAALVATSAFMVPALFPQSAMAQAYPAKRITLVVPFNAGSITDGLARSFANGLTEKLGQPVVVDNRVGAGGNIGHDYIAKAPADGYTIGLLTSMTTPKALRPTSSFDPLHDFTYLGRFAETFYTLLVNPEVPAKNLRELIAYAKANPGKLNFGVVSAGMMVLERKRFADLVGADILEVPYNGGAPLTTAILGGQVHMAFLGSSVLPQIKAGKLVSLAALGKQRWSALPDVPTAAEQGVDFQSGYWFGFGGPAGLPAPIRDRLAGDIATVAKTQDVKDSITKTWGMVPIDPSPAEMMEVVKKELAVNEAVAKKVGL